MRVGHSLTYTIRRRAFDIKNTITFFNTILHQSGFNNHAISLLYIMSLGVNL